MNLIETLVALAAWDLIWHGGAIDPGLLYDEEIDAAYAVATKLQRWPSFTGAQS